MGKFTAYKKLTKQEQQDLFIGFAKALASVRNSVEAANVIRDLLSEQESLMLARRLQVARLLEQGLTYERIRKVLQVSFSTITRVQTWLNLYGEGYRMMLKRTEFEPVKSETFSTWGKLKRKYPLYFWPELLLTEIVKSANKREKDRLVKVIAQIKEKTKLNKQLLEILKSDKNYHTQ